MKLAVALAVLPAAAAFVGPAAAPAETRLQESKSDLEALAKGLNPTIGFWDPLNVAGASGSLYGFNNEQTIAWYGSRVLVDGVEGTQSSRQLTARRNAGTGRRRSSTAAWPWRPSWATASRRTAATGRRR